MGLVGDWMGEGAQSVYYWLRIHPYVFDLSTNLVDPGEYMNQSQSRMVVRNELITYMPASARAV